MGRQRLTPRSSVPLGAALAVTLAAFAGAPLAEAERTAKERTATERTTAARTAAERNAAEHTAVERTAADGTTTDTGLATRATVHGAPVSAADRSATAPEASAKTIYAYQPTGIVAATLPELRAALASGRVSAEDLTRSYLERIEAVDRNGPTLRAVLSVNPQALADARRADEALAGGQRLGPLHGLPLLLKDNIESRDPLPTTAGALALQHNVTGRDAPLVAGLRAAGAIILGKTNLSQWANFRSEHSLSGWSALGGQVRNPHMLDRNPCGSSSGSGAAAAASLAAGSIGTETNGSIICPAAINGIVGFKPTVGRVSQQYIVPISSSQDTAGPMTKTVTGSALLFAAMAGVPTKDVLAALNTDALAGKRLGVLRYAVGGDPRIVERFDAALGKAEAAGATLVPITQQPPQPDDFRADSYLVLKYEFRRTVNAYLQDSPAMLPARTLRGLIEYNRQHAARELALFDQDIFEASEATVDVPAARYEDARRKIQYATRVGGIDYLLAHYKVDALVFPARPLAPPIDAINGDVWPASVGAGWLAAIAGYPHITVPIGTVKHLPVGLSVVAAADQDLETLALGYAFEQHAGARAEPRYLATAAAATETAKALARLPDERTAAR